MVNVSAPKIGPSQPQKNQETPETKPLGLTVALSKEKASYLKPLVEIYSICLELPKSEMNPASKFMTTDKYLEQSDSGDKEVDVKTYDFPTLYNHLRNLKRCIKMRSY